jgi:hypothetical protein
LLSQSRTALALGASGIENLAVISEFNAAISLPPNVVVALADALKASIDTYEKTFGKIPTDPNASLSTENPLSAENPFSVKK